MAPIPTSNDEMIRTNTSLLTRTSGRSSAMTVKQVSLCFPPSSMSLKPDRVLLHPKQLSSSSSSTPSYNDVQDKKRHDSSWFFYEIDDASTSSTSASSSPPPSPPSDKNSARTDSYETLNDDDNNRALSTIRGCEKKSIVQERNRRYHKIDKNNSNDKLDETSPLFHRKARVIGRTVSLPQISSSKTQIPSITSLINKSIVNQNKKLFRIIPERNDSDEQLVSRNDDKSPTNGFRSTPSSNNQTNPRRTASSSHLTESTSDTTTVRILKSSSFCSNSSLAEMIYDDEPQWTKSQMRARSLNTVGTTHFRAGRYDEAMKAYGEALWTVKSRMTSIVEEDEEEDDDDDNNNKGENKHRSEIDLQNGILSAHTLNSMATVHWRRDEVNDALDALKEAWTAIIPSSSSVQGGIDSKYIIAFLSKSSNLKIKRSTSAFIKASRYMAIISILFNFAIVHYMNNDLDDAASMLEEALKVQRRIAKHEDNPESNAQIARITGMLGTILQRKGDLKTAMKLHQNVLRTKHSSLNDPDHPSIAVTLQNIGHIHFLQYRQNQTLTEELDSACRAFMESLRIQERHLHRENVDVGVTLQHIGRIYHVKGELELAMKTYKEVSRIYETAGLDHKHMIMVALLHDMADITSKTWREGLQPFSKVHVAHKKDAAKKWFVPFRLNLR